MDGIIGCDIAVGLFYPSLSTLASVTVAIGWHRKTRAESMREAWLFGPFSVGNVQRQRLSHVHVQVHVLIHSPICLSRLDLRVSAHSDDGVCELEVGRVRFHGPLSFILAARLAWSVPVCWFARALSPSSVASRCCCRVFAVAVEPQSRLARENRGFLTLTFGSQPLSDACCAVLAALAVLFSVVA